MPETFSAGLLLIASVFALLAALRLAWRLQGLGYARRIDPITGLAGRKCLERRLQQFLAKPEPKACLIGIDFSHLRVITETHGWSAGDEMLRQLAAKLTQKTSKNGVIVRLSGTEFALLLPNVPDAFAANEQARALLEMLQQPISWQDQTLNLNFSLGLAILRSGESPTTALRELSSALAGAKQSGPGAISFYDPKLEERITQNLRIENHIREGLAKGYFHLALQPIFDVAQGHLKGFEALIRLIHPTHGPLSPAQFIPIAETTGLIHELGEWTLHEACRIARKWPDGYKIAVNLSPVQFRSGKLISQLRDVLEFAKLPAYQLELEVTEGLMLEDSDYVKTQLNGIRDMGISLSLDDFGTGYSSLSYLWQFPFRKLKLDQSFMRNMEHTPQISGIVSAIMALARNLGLPVTAEGIETAEQLAFLKRLGCDEAQGFYLGKPMPEKEAHQLITQDQEARSLKHKADLPIAQAS